MYLYNSLYHNHLQLIIGMRTNVLWTVAFFSFPFVCTCVCVRVCMRDDDDVWLGNSLKIHKKENVYGQMEWNYPFPNVSIFVVYGIIPIAVTTTATSGPKELCFKILIGKITNRTRQLQGIPAPAHPSPTYMGSFDSNLLQTLSCSYGHYLNKIVETDEEVLNAHFVLNWRPR